MARPRQNTIAYEQNARKNFLLEIEGRCGFVGLKTNEALGDAIGVTGNTVGNFKKDPGRIRMDVMQKLVKALKLDPGVVLSYLGYSEQEKRKFAKEYLQ